MFGWSTWAIVPERMPSAIRQKGTKSRASKTKLWQCDPALKCIMNHILPKTTRQAVKASIKPHIIQSYRCPSNFISGNRGEKDEATKFHPPKTTLTMNHRITKLKVITTNRNTTLNHSFSPNFTLLVAMPNCGNINHIRIATRSWLDSLGLGKKLQVSSTRCFCAAPGLENVLSGFTGVPKIRQWNCFFWFGKMGNSIQSSGTWMVKPWKFCHSIVGILVHWMPCISEKCCLRFLGFEGECFWEP